MAEGLLRAELARRGKQRLVGVDSAGTHVGQKGAHADARAQQVCAREGIDLRKSRSRQVVEDDFYQFDRILALDHKNLEWLAGTAPEDAAASIDLLGDCAELFLGDVPDPYYGSVSAFEQVMAQLHRAVDGLLAELSLSLEDAN